MNRLTVSEAGAKAIISEHDDPLCYVNYIDNLNVDANIFEAADFQNEFWDKHLELDPDALIESTISGLVNNIPWEFVEGAAEVRRELETYLESVDYDRIWTRQYERNSWHKCGHCGNAVMP